MVWFGLNFPQRFHEVLWGIHRVLWGFHEVFPALPCSALMLLRQWVSEWVSQWVTNLGIELLSQLKSLKGPVSALQKVGINILIKILWLISINYFIKIHMYDSSSLWQPVVADAFWLVWIRGANQIMSNHEYFGRCMQRLQTAPLTARYHTFKQ